jgi:hypothetical protein
MREQNLITVGELAGTFEYCPHSDTYIARIRGKENIVLSSRVFGNGVIAEDWLLDMLEYPAFVYLAKA